MLQLERGSLTTSIVAEEGFRCADLRLGDWPILGPTGIGLRFFHADDNPWHVDSRGDDPRGAWVTARTTRGSNEVEATWCLSLEGLQIALVVANRGPGHALFGMGVRLDLKEIGDHVQALAPAEDIWPIDSDGQVTGPPQTARGRFDLRRPREVDCPLEALYTRRHFANLRTQAAVIAPTSGREVWFTSSADFRELDLSLDVHGAGRLESLTCVPSVTTGAIGGAVTGLRRLAPREMWRGDSLIVARAGTR